ncbi:hypothetical protein D9M68_883910 [compost metagenome]
MRPQCQQRPLEVERVVERSTVFQPDVRRASTGAGRRHVFVGLVGWGFGAIGHDDGRSVVAATKGHARYVELQSHVRVEVRRRGLSGELTAGRVLLQFCRGLEQTHRVGKVPGIARVAFGQRLALGLVGVQQ